MIIFDLDGTLADCEHRRKHIRKEIPDWKSFNEHCDKDLPIHPVIKFAHILHFLSMEYEIWSGRCESTRDKTMDWLSENDIQYCELKMRPIGDNTPDQMLKEKWLDEALASGKKIEAVFDDRQKVVEMWIKREIFVFDVSQGKGNF